ncbi:hypothetical protein D3Z52_19535 [Clostridiaceae bacterium]|nr:hypothetical protein [Clostridiaceae bacterium]
MKKSLCFILSLLCLVSSAFAADQSGPEAVPDENIRGIDTPYEYPVTLDMPEWAELTSLEQKLEVCQIPEDILSALTTPALIETVLDYPLAVNIYAHGGAVDGIEAGVEVVSGQFNGLAELLRRQSEEPADTNAALSVYAVRTSARDAEDFESIFAEDLLSCLLSEAPVSAQSASSTGSVTTPNGSKVPAYKELTWSDHGTTKSGANRMNEQYLKTYPSATLLRDAAPAYNCHSYAWYDDSSKNPYWIDDPSEYILDGSYHETSEYYVDSIVLYGEPGRSPSHSGIVSGISDRHHLTYVISKWRYYGLFEHLYYDCPFAGSVHTYR